MRLKLLRVIAVLALLGEAALVGAVLPPAAYERMKRAAPVAFSGMVASDVGGEARVRVQSVERGPLKPGVIVAVLYPEHYGQEIPAGGDYWYKRFAPGDLLQVWGKETGPGIVTIVPAGLVATRKGPAPAPQFRLDRLVERSGLIAAALALAAVFVATAWFIARRFRGPGRSFLRASERRSR